MARRSFLRGTILPALVVFLAAAVGATLGQRGPAAPPESVLLVVCDTLRADHLGLYGYGRPTSPFLDHAARHAQVYDAAYSHYSYTWPTVANLLSGRPYSALVHDGQFQTVTAGLASGGLTPQVDTLAERLARRGVASVAVSANPYLSAHIGFGQGFATYHEVLDWDPDFWHSSLPKYRAERLNARALELLRKLASRRRPWFAYLHYFDPHMPYLPEPADAALFVHPGVGRPGRFVDGYLRGRDGQPLNFLTPDLAGSWIDAGDVRHLTDEYDAEVHHFDRGMEQLFAALDAAGILRGTTVILTADHGEALLERGYWGHGYLSRAEEEHVPMLVFPARSRADLPPGRIAEPVTTSDVFFSVLRHFGALDSAAARDPLWTFDLLAGEQRRPVVYTEGGHAALIWRSRGLAYYRYTGFSATPTPLRREDGESLFDLRRDPGERDDLFARDPARARALRDELLRRATAPASARHPAVVDPMKQGDEESRRRLKALGYF